MVQRADRDSNFRDDEILTKVLSAAYSLQQQHDRIQSKLPAARFSIILAEISNTQTLIREQGLDPANALRLIANRAEKLVGAAGAAIAVLQGEVLHYKAATGIAATLCGFKARAHEIISFERLRSEPLVQMDAWQEKVIGGRVGANVLSAPVYRQRILGGCIKLFSRHGHFNFDGGYVCELMSGIVSHVLETMPVSPDPSEEPHDSLPIAGASQRDNTERPTAGTREKLEWPGTKTRELEARLKKAAMSANTAERALRTLAAGESIKFSPPSMRTSQQESHRARPPEVSVIREKEESKDTNPQNVSRSNQEPGRSYGSLALVPSETHAPRSVSGPLAVGDKSIPQKTWTDGGREPRPDVSPIVVQQPLPAPTSRTAKANEHSPRGKNWKRMSRMVYPIFVLLFAVGVRIRAGAHNWPVEVIIYILLVLTTLELQSRWSKG